MLIQAYFIEMQQAYFNLHTHHKPVKGARIIRNAYHFLQPQVISNLGYDVCCGIHPMHIGREDAKFEHLEKLVNQNHVVAIGECGLDSRFVNIEKQKQVLQQHAQLSNTYQLPLIIHCVKMHEPLMQILQHHHQPVVMHGYLAAETITKKYMDSLDIYFSFGKSMFHANNKELIRKTVELAGMEKIFLETDNSHYAINEVYATFAAIINIEEDKLMNQIERNVEKVFSQKK